MKIQTILLAILTIAPPCFANCPSTAAVQAKAYLTENWKPVLPIIAKRNTLLVRTIERAAHKAPIFTGASVSPSQVTCFYKTENGMVFHLVNYKSAQVLLTPGNRWHVTQMPIDHADPQFWGCMAKHGTPEDCPFQFNDL